MVIKNHVSITQMKSQCFNNRKDMQMIQTKKIIHKNQIQNKHIEAIFKIQNVEIFIKNKVIFKHVC